MTNELELMYN